MAIKYAVRWRPAAYRSTIEAIVINDDPGDPNAVPPRPRNLGQRVQTLQLCVYDDTAVGTAGNPYEPGAPATEQHVSIVTELAIMLDVIAFAGLTNAQATALWNTARDQQFAAWQADPQIMAYVRAAIGGSLSGLVVMS